MVWHNPSRAELHALLQNVRSVAIVGLSTNPARASNEVAGFLVRRGYRCFGVNPHSAGEKVHGITIVPRLADLPEPVDMIDIFREPAAVGPLVDEVLALRVRPRIIWMQLGVINEPAAALARAEGLTVVMDACPKIVLSR
jgi:predicted CoA-binding protein